MENEINNLKNKTVTPIAYIKTFSGMKFVIEIQKDEGKSYAMVNPPNYEIIEENDESLPASAIGVHYFIPYDGELYSYEEYKEKLNLLGEELSKNTD